MGAKTTTIRIDDTVLGRVDGLAKSINRSRNWVIQQAVERYLDYEEWFVDQVEQGLDEVKRDKTIAHEEIMAEMRNKVAKKRR